MRSHTREPRTQGRNIVVTIAGRTPEIVVGAHYDAARRDRQVRAMVNLDVNGFGDTVICGPRAGSNDVPFQALRSVCLAIGSRCVEYGARASGLQPGFTPEILRAIHTAADTSALIDREAW